jgi:hypothetical protein
VGPRCSFCGSERGPFLNVEGGLRLQMCPACQTARGHGPAELEAAYDPGQPWLKWTCPLCPYQVDWGADLEPHTAKEHPGWTAEWQILSPYPRQRLRVVYRRAGDPGPGA